MLLDCSVDNQWNYTRLARYTLVADTTSWFGRRSTLGWPSSVTRRGAIAVILGVLVFGVILWSAAAANDDAAAPMATPTPALPSVAVVPTFSSIPATDNPPSPPAQPAIVPGGVPRVVPQPNVAPAPGPSPAATPPAQVAAANTGGLGVNLRSAPGTGSSVITTIPEGSPLVPLGPTTAVNGATWVQGRDGGGNVGWVDREYLANVA